jgi:ArsR family transcriptional regulator
VKNAVDKELLFRALADRTRLRLLNLLGDDEVCVCFLVEVLGISQPKVSRHLAYLKRAGIVKSRRDGKWMHYRIAGPSDRFAAGLLRNVCAWLSQDKAMRADRKRLVNFPCSPDVPFPLQSAPKPRMRATNRIGAEKGHI